MGHLDKTRHAAVLASGLSPSYFWVPETVTAGPLLPLCPSPAIFFTALFPLLSTDLATKCFPSLLAIFIPLSELFPLVNSFLAWGGQPSPGASQHRAGRRCGVGGHLEEKEELRDMGQARPLGTAFCSDGSGGSSSSSKMLIHFSFRFVKTFL